MEANHGIVDLWHIPFCQTIPLLQGNDMLQNHFLSIAAHSHQVLKYGHTYTPRYRASKIIRMYQFQSHDNSNIEYLVMIEIKKQKDIGSKNK